MHLRNTMQSNLTDRPAEPTWLRLPLEMHLARALDASRCDYRCELLTCAQNAGNGCGSPLFPSFQHRQRRGGKRGTLQTTTTEAGMECVRKTFAKHDHPPTQHSRTLVLTHLSKQGNKETSGGVRQDTTHPPAFAYSPILARLGDTGPKRVCLCQRHHRAIRFLSDEAFLLLLLWCNRSPFSPVSSAKCTGIRS